MFSHLVIVSLVNMSHYYYLLFITSTLHVWVIYCFIYFTLFSVPCLLALAPNSPTFWGWQPRAGGRWERRDGFVWGDCMSTCMHVNTYCLHVWGHESLCKRAHKHPRRLWRCLAASTCNAHDDTRANWATNTHNARDTHTSCATNTTMLSMTLARMGLQTPVMLTAMFVQVGMCTCALASHSWGPVANSPQPSSGQQSTG